MTAAGASLVFGTKNVPRKLLDAMLGFAAGGTVAASLSSLLAPAGGSLVVGTKNVRRRLLGALVGCAAGVMIAASFWSLLAPAIDLSESGSLPSWVPPVIGFLVGGVFLRLLDRALPHLHPGMKMSEAEGPHTSWRRSVLLVSAITLHNIPEGLAVGVAFGAVGAGITSGVPGATRS